MDGKYGRTQKVMKMDRERHYAGLANNKPKDKATIDFNRGAYQSIDVSEYIKKLKKGKQNEGK